MYMAQKAKKKSKLRHAEYYDMQKTFDSLYADSKSGEVFGHLMDIISAPSNIKLVSLMRTIPGMTILNPADDVEARAAVEAAVKYQDKPGLCQTAYGNPEKCRHCCQHTRSCECRSCKIGR